MAEVDTPKTLARPAAQEVQATLTRILDSPAFRKSEQCRKFLTYVVEHSRDGHDELLKERNIGIEVFGRAPDYDTAEDPVVRVRATEVRKRLAQYHSESGTAADVRMDIPAGSYRVEFHPPAAPRVEPPQSPAASLRRRILWGTAALALAGLAWGALSWNRRPGPQSVVDRFWAPVLASEKAVLVYCGQPVVYFLSREVHDRYRDTIPADKRRGSYALQLDAREVLHGSDVIPVSDQFVGIGNAHTAAMLTGMFAARRKPVEIRYANDLSFSDLRSSPSVLIGAFSNLWTLEMQSGLQFVFEQENGARRIRDKSDGRTWQLASLAPDGKTPEDYAVVSRMFDSATGQLLISAAGITQYGTRAAGEFLTNMTDSLGSGWERRNLQVLLHTKVYNGTPGRPEIVARHVW